MAGRKEKAHTADIPSIPEPLCQIGLDLTPHLPELRGPAPSWEPQSPADEPLKLTSCQAKRRWPLVTERAAGLGREERAES